jgi:hypothetical protein
MRMGIKRLLMFGYCHGWIAAETVTAAFQLLRLRGA